jgi:acetyl esterase/lipase
MSAWLRPQFSVGGFTMKRSVQLCLALALCFSAATLHAENGVKITPDVIYGHKDGMALTFDVFRPEANANGAGVLFMVSGGWVSRWSPPERSMARFKAFLDKGFTVFAVRHGSSPKYKVPEALSDVRRAVRYVRANSETLGVDENRLGVFGGSAGGHLSLMLGTASDEGKTDGEDAIEKTSNRVAAVCAYFPPVDLRQIVGPSDRFPALDFDPKDADSVSPILHVSPDDPPTLLVHGDKDDLVPISNSERIHAEFQKHNVTTEFITLPGAGHGFRGEDGEKAMTAVVDWFSKYLNAPQN